MVIPALKWDAVLSRDGDNRTKVGPRTIPRLCSTELLCRTGKGRARSWQNESHRTKTHLVFACIETIIFRHGLIWLTNLQEAICEMFEKWPQCREAYHTTPKGYRIQLSWVAQMSRHLTKGVSKPSSQPRGRAFAFGRPFRYK